MAIATQREFEALRREELAYSLINLAKRFVASSSKKHPMPKDPVFKMAVEDTERGMVLKLELEYALARRVKSE